MTSHFIVGKHGLIVRIALRRKNEAYSTCHKVAAWFGRAISMALNTNGYQIATVYHGNDKAAQTFYSETAIRVFKWDVSDFEACGAEIEDVEKQLGPIEILVNNAGITRDAMLVRRPNKTYSRVI